MAVPSKRVHSSTDTEDQVRKQKKNHSVAMKNDNNDNITQSNSKYQKFKEEPLDDCIDYVSLQSSLSLLNSRLASIKREVKELKVLKQKIKSSEDVKSLTKMISSNTDYLNEISYKGAFIKCPEIDWKKDYDIDMEELQSNDNDLPKINDGYEILKRDTLFSYDKLK